MNLEQLKTALEYAFPRSKGEPRVACEWESIEGDQVLMIHLEDRILVLDQNGTATLVGNCLFPETP